MAKRAVRSFTATSPRVSDSKIARRLGSASAWKILFSATAALGMGDTLVSAYAMSSEKNRTSDPNGFLGLRSPRSLRLLGTVEGDRLANERFEGGCINLFPFADVDRASCASLETRVEETGRILQRRALEEGQLHDVLVGLARADDAVVRPNRRAHPLQLLDDVRVCFLDERPHSAEDLPAPVPEFGDPLRDEFRCRPASARGRLFHGLIVVVRSIRRIGCAGRIDSTET